MAFIHIKQALFFLSKAKDLKFIKTTGLFLLIFLFFKFMEGSAALSLAESSLY